MIWAAFFCVCLIVAGSNTLVRGSEDSDAAVQQGQRALKSQSRLPWYDSSQDDLKPLKMQPHRLAKPVVPSNLPNWSLPDWLVETLTILIEVIFFTVLAALLVGIAYYLIKTIRARGAAARATKDLGEEQETLKGDVDRVENLPFPLQRPRGDLLSEAQRRYDEGDYSGAIIYLYSYELLQLDKHHLIELSQGKTNRQYLREVRPMRRLAQLVEDTMVTFEDAFFGRYTIQKDRFETCWRGLNEFHQLVRGEATS